ncbi:MAG: DUF86 domain-containing protein [Rickettsiales bacterium]
MDHIAECAADIAVMVAEGKAEFLKRKKTYWAILRQLQVMAESCKRLAATTKDMIPADWKAIMGLRNILVHEYLGVLDDAILWEVLTNHVPTLARHVADYRKPNNHE